MVIGQKKADGTIDLDKYIITNETMLFPINHLQDSTGNHYSLQLSMYDYLIEQWGFKCLGNMLCHIRTVENPMIPDDMPHEKLLLLLILNILKQKLKPFVIIDLLN